MKQVDGVTRTRYDLSMSHAYLLDIQASGNVDVTCTACGPQGLYPRGEAVTAFVQIHDRHHAVEHHAHRPTQAEIDAWLAGPESKLWEPSAEERAGTVAVALGYVAFDEAVAEARTHQCSDDLDTRPRTLRLLDENERAADFTVPTEGVALRCVIERLNADSRIVKVWYVRERDEEGQAITT